MLRWSIPGIAIAFFALAVAPVGAQTLGNGTLGDLPRAKAGRLIHFSSTDPTGGNGDARRVAPGQTYTLVDYHGGPGAVRRWWVTLAPRNNVQIQRQCIIRCYWDGEKEPSVECPVSDFFGLGFGQWKDYQSLPLNMTSGGYNCYWPMPFAHSCRITLENRSQIPLEALYYNIDIRTAPAPDKEQLYFHAQFRRTTTRPGQPVTILEATGQGHYVGTVLSMQYLHKHGLGFLEGDEQVSVDGESSPSIRGTGTEDYFSSGWYFDTGPYSALYHGAPIRDDATGRISAYRWHIEDPIPFTRSIRFQIEHGGRNDAPPADYCSVAFWYQTHPHAPFPPLPADLLPAPAPVAMKIEGLIEGESLVASARATAGAIDHQEMGGYAGDWSGDAQLFWMPHSVGARLTLTFPADAAGDKEIVGYFTRARDYGDITVSVNDRRLGTFSGYAAYVSASGAISLGRAPIRAGDNTMILEVTGKNAASTGYLAGLDGFLLQP